MTLENQALLDGRDLSRDEYGDFYKGYLDKSRGENLIVRLQDGKTDVLDTFSSLNDEKALFRYAAGKWTLKEVMGHLVDTERVFQYRALSISRNGRRALPGYDHEEYVERAGFNQMALEDLLTQYQDTRQSTISLFSSFTDKHLGKRGVVNGCMFTVRALGYVIAGHELKHLDTIREKYLNGLSK
jgi:hypothetical protein